MNVKIKKEIVNFCLAIIVLILSSKIKITIPYTSIPITIQSLSVLTISYYYGYKGFIYVLIFVLLGIIGLPIFASNTTGIELIFGKSGGYIYGFIIASLIVNLLRSTKIKNFWLKISFSMILGTLIILFFGTLHLSLLIGFDKALIYGLYPFVLGAIIKILIAVLLLYFLLQKFRKT